MVMTFSITYLEIFFNKMHQGNGGGRQLNVFRMKGFQHKSFSENFQNQQGKLP